MVEDFAAAGFVVMRDVVPSSVIDRFFEVYLTTVASITSQHFTDPFASDLAEYFTMHRRELSEVYDAISRSTIGVDLSSRSEITAAVREVMRHDDIELFRKVVVRLDMPLETRELAHWHQDHFYVRGNVDIVTAWIPLQDTTFLNGCLAVMPGSHDLGPLDHDLKIGKRDVPSGVFDREVRLVEMRQRDILIFHSLLVHSSTLNLSRSLRYSVQPRFTMAGASTDAAMRGTIGLGGTE